MLDATAGGRDHVCPWGGGEITPCTMGVGSSGRHRQSGPAPEPATSRPPTAPAVPQEANVQADPSSRDLDCCFTRADGASGTPVRLARAAVTRLNGRSPGGGGHAQKRMICAGVGTLRIALARRSYSAIGADLAARRPANPITLCDGYGSDFVTVAGQILHSVDPGRVSRRLRALRRRSSRRACGASA
jgi:hypothetical protein